jgi:hypothetical protein
MQHTDQGGRDGWNTLHEWKREKILTGVLVGKSESKSLLQIKWGRQYQNGF